MAFWTESSPGEPKQKFKFLLESPTFPNFSGRWIFAKSITKPSYEINTTSYQIGNHNIKYPGVVTWKDIDVKVVDYQDGESVTSALYANLINMGYENPKDQPWSEGIGKNSVATIDKFTIFQLNSLGEAVETWTLFNVIVSSVAFGDLSYSEDGLVELNLTLAYDYATLQ